MGWVTARSGTHLIGVLSPDHGRSELRRPRAHDRAHVGCWRSGTGGGRSRDLRPLGTLRGAGAVRIGRAANAVVRSRMPCPNRRPNRRRRAEPRTMASQSWARAASAMTPATLKHVARANEPEVSTPPSVSSRTAPSTRRDASVPVSLVIPRPPTWNWLTWTTWTEAPSRWARALAKLRVTGHDAESSMATSSRWNMAFLRSRAASPACRPCFLCFNHVNSQLTKVKYSPITPMVHHRVLTRPASRAAVRLTP